jgi:hypothetical protein
VASQLILVAIGSGTRKMFMPKQSLHTHEEVFKDHVSGQYDETIFRFRVPGGWIYTHTIIRFGSVDKIYVADTFVPDSKVDMNLPIHHTRMIRDAIFDLGRAPPESVAFPPFRGKHHAPVSTPVVRHSIRCN